MKRRPVQTTNDEATATLIVNSTGERYDLPIRGGTVGPKAIDVRSLYQKTSMFTYDPGYASTASCDSDLTYIDGE